MRLSDLCWDSPNNVALSLQFLGEMIRRGEMPCPHVTESEGDSVTLTISAAPARKIANVR